MSTAKSRSLKSPSLRLVRGPINGITEYRLSNGLKVLLMPENSAPVVTTLLVYRVGSRNEGPGNSGSAHFFEHLMFKGSGRFNEEKGNNIDQLMKQIGGQLNAYTSYDQTVYHEQVSAEYLELCFAIEADRMRGLRMRQADRDSEMTVVRNEMEQGENWPQQAMNKLMMATAFTQHPYHHDVIGARTEVENVPLANMRDFYHTFYWPNNATLIVVGDFDPDEAQAKIVKHFGPIPRSPHRIPKVYTVEPPQEGERRFVVRRHGNMHRLDIGFHVPEAVHADQPALQVLARVMGSSWSRSSRLYKRLVDGKLASFVSAYSQEMRDPGLFDVGVELTEGTSLADAEAAVFEVIERLKTELVPSEELERFKQGERKDRALRLAESKYFGYQLANAEAVAEWRWLFTSADAFDAVTAEDVQRVARRYLTRDNCTIGAFLPQTDDEVAARNAERPTEAPQAVAVKPKKQRKSLRKAPADAAMKTIRRLSGSPKANSRLSERLTIRRLANGLTVQVLPAKLGGNAVAIVPTLKVGNYFEGDDKQNLADIVASMLPMGSEELTKEQLADALTELGNTYGLHFQVGPYTGQLNTLVQREDLPLMLGLLNTFFTKPVFDATEFETVKRKWVGDYKDQIVFPGSVAQNRLGNTLYKPGQMFYQKTLEEQMADLERMTLDDVRAFHSANYTPSATLITIVGDVDPEQAIAQVEAAFGEWQGPQSRPISVPAPSQPEKSRRIVINMPDKPGIEIVVGAPAALKRSDPDWDAANVALRVLGGDTLTARLGKKLREEGGLTYGVRAFQWDQSYGGAPWAISLSVNAQNIEPALEKLHEVLADFVENGITDEELETEMRNMSGQQRLRLAGLQEIASAIGTATALGLEIEEHIDGYAARLRKLTKEDVNAAIRKHFAGENLVTVIAGEVA